MRSKLASWFGSISVGLSSAFGGASAIGQTQALPNNTSRGAQEVDPVGQNIINYAKGIIRNDPIKSFFDPNTAKPTRMDYIKQAYGTNHDEVLRLGREYREKNPGEYATSLEDRTLTNPVPRSALLGSASTPAAATPTGVKINPAWLFIGAFSAMHEAEHAMGQQLGRMPKNDVNDLASYITRPNELAVRMATIKRLYSAGTGRNIDNPYEAVRAHKAFGLDMDEKVVSKIFTDKGMEPPKEELKQAPFSQDTMSAVKGFFLDVDQLLVAVNGCQDYTFSSIQPWYAEKGVAQNATNMPAMKKANPRLYKETLEKLIFTTPGHVFNSTSEHDKNFGFA